MNASNPLRVGSQRWLWHISVIFGLLAVTAMTVGCQREQVEDEEPVEAGTVEPTEEGEEEVGAVEEIKLETAFLEPGENLGMTVSGKAPVTEVISDRGFWLGHKGKRIFAVVREDVPRNEMIDINAGQVLELKGQLLDSDDLSEAVEGTLEAQTRDTIEGQDHFLAVHHRDVQIVSQPKAGADQKMLKFGGEEFGSYADYDADKNSLVTTRELTRGLEDREFFGGWDKDDDEQLDESEFFATVYSMVDVDQNDRITEDEFAMLQDNFDKFEGANFFDWDENDNDWLDNEEFFTQLRDEEFFEDWDANTNGYVEYGEYSENLFSLWDEDEDGFLNLDEFGFDQDVEMTRK